MLSDMNFTKILNAFKQKVWIWRNHHSHFKLKISFTLSIQLNKGLTFQYQKIILCFKLTLFKPTETEMVVNVVIVPHVKLLSDIINNIIKEV